MDYKNTECKISLPFRSIMDYVLSFYYFNLKTWNIRPSVRHLKSILLKEQQKCCNILNIQLKPGC